jgi:hypothetical protein
MLPGQYPQHRLACLLILVNHSRRRPHDLAHLPLQLMRRSRQLAHLANLLRLPPRPGKNTLPIRQLCLAPSRPHQGARAFLLKAPRLPNRYTPIIS